MTTGTKQDGGAPTQEPHGGDHPPRIRASDAERVATVERLKDAVVHGLLTPDEGSDRMATAFATRFRDELPVITADLPAQPVAGAASTPGWRALGAGLVGQVRHEVDVTRAAGLRSRRFLIGVLAAVLLLGLLVALVGLAAHGLVDGSPLDGGRFDTGPFDGGHGH